MDDDELMLDEDESVEARPDAEPMADSMILSILKAERERSVGFDYDATLNDDRERALNYYKGDVSADMPALENRSSVTSTDVSDVIERALPDLIEMFASGDDGIALQAHDDEDEDAVLEETDYVRHVIFKQNKGFMTLYTMFKDALLSKVGVVKYYWDAKPEFQQEEGLVNDVQLQDMQDQGVEVIEIGDVDEDGLIQVTINKMIRDGQVKIKAVTPEDFTVAEDTVELSEATYCAYRSRVRVQDLISDGHDPEKVKLLGQDSEGASESVELARDTGDERAQSEDENAAVDELRTVEVIEHYLRFDIEGAGEPQIWRIITGNDEAVLLDKEKRSRIEFAAVTPYPMTHRFYGQSAADKLVEIQKWKTALIRMLNDAGYMANNQRQEVNVDQATDETVPALLDNQPGRPVPSKGNALKPIANAGLPFDILSAIEFADTVGESRTGVMRHAQGINPDALHDTALGAKVLISAAQKAQRMMARLFAEMGLTDLYLGVHDLLRSNATMTYKVKLNEQWVPVSPSSWQRRRDTDIETGDQSKEDEIQTLNVFADRIAQIVEMQGGPDEEGMVTTENIYNLTKGLGRRLRIKNVDRYISKPRPVEQQQGDDQAQSPEMMEAMARIKVKEYEAEQDARLAREKAESEHQLEMERMNREHELAMRRQELEAIVGANTTTPLDAGGALHK